MADSLDGSVKVPVVGTVPKKAVAGGVLVVAVLIIVYYVRKNNSASSQSAADAASQAASSTDQYPPDGTVGNPSDPYSTDPATGQTYGDEATGSGGTYGAYGGYGAAVTDTYPWDGTTGNEADPYSLDPATGVTFGDEGLATGGSSQNPTGGPPFANNSDWEVWVTNQLEQTDPGINAGDLTQALGLYLNGQPVSAAQKTLVFDATGVGGDPPVAGPQNYPPNVRTDGSTGPATAAVAVPNVVGQPQEAAYAIISEAGLHPSGSKTISGTTIYVTSQSPAAGKKVASGSTVTLVSKPKTTTVTVPDIVGKDTAAAGPVIQRAGLVMTPNPAAVKGKSHVITSQSPKAGSKVAKGSKVTIQYKTT